MQRFVLLTGLFLGLAGAGFLAVLALADGYTDPFYLRFATPRQTSLILGTSRSAQGLQPAVFNQLLPQTLFNYSFTISHSPYGPTYLASVLRKLDRSRPTGRGVFILGVDPWALASSRAHPNDSTAFEENTLCLANTTTTNWYPNFEYLLQNLKGNYFAALTSNRFTQRLRLAAGRRFVPALTAHNGLVFLHHDGWLEVTVPMDAASQRQRLQAKLAAYSANLAAYRLSRVRLAYLIKTIEALKPYGAVYLVRLPVHPRLHALDTTLAPNFNEVLRPARQRAAGFLDLTPDNARYQYTDGNHLHPASGRAVSARVARWISQLPK